MSALAILGATAAIVSLFANGPKAWPGIKHVGRESACLARTLHKCEKEKKHV